MNYIETDHDLDTRRLALNHDRASTDARGDILRRRWWLILILALAIAAATYAVSSRVPAQFSSTASLSIQVKGSNDPNDSVTAANNMASQYAQLVTGASVLQTAAQTLSRSDARGLSTAVSGGTVADQNIVQVRASGSSPGQAQRRASAVVTALGAYVNRISSHATDAYSSTARAQLKPVDAQIAKISAQIASASHDTLTSGRYVALQATLSTLIAQRSSAEAAIAQNATNGQPTLDLVSAAGSGSQVAPKPKLYAGVAFVLALILVSQAVVFLAPRPLSVAVRRQST